VTIDHCTNSTIREAWAGVLGVPGKVDPNEATFIARVAQRADPTIALRPVGRLVPQHAYALSLDPGEVAPPLWTHQATWNDGEGLARFGHRMLTVHHMVREGSGYDRYSTSLRPDVVRWLRFLHEAYDFAATEEIPASTVMFGYTNVFGTLPFEMDVSEYFHVNVGIEARGAEEGLSRLAVGARISGNDGLTRTHLQFQVEPGENDEFVVVTTNVVSEVDLKQPALLTEAERLDSEILNAKTIAKETFFSFVTERTKELMGAVE